MRKVLCVVLLAFMLLELNAQQYTGLSGLIHVPSAEMEAEGDARIGIHFLNKMFTPGHLFSYEGNKYNTFSYYLSITPFRWIELGYTCTYIKKIWNTNSEYYGEKAKDRYFSLKLNPIKEGKWWPSIALGCNDVSNSYSIFNTNDEAVEAYFGNYYVAVSKHVHINMEEIGFHISYRHYVKSYNSKWNGIVGGITYRPSFARNLRGILEYTGNEINIGADCLLWRHLLLQASLQDGKYFSGGICFQTNLF